MKPSGKGMENFVNSYFILCLLFCAAEQMLTAGTTMIMIQIGRCMEQPMKLLFWMTVFILSLFAVFFPRYGYQRFLLLAKYRGFQSYIRNFEDALRYKPYLAKEKKIGGESKTFFHNETWNVVNESYDFILDFVLTFLNICFSVIVIGAQIEGRFFAGYFLAFAIALGMYFVFKGKVERFSLKSQNAHVEMNSVLLYGWDTMLADNPYNHLMWRDAWNSRIEHAVGWGIRRLRFVSALSGAAMLLSAVPVLFVLMDSYFRSQSPAHTAVLAVTLPRQINTIQYLNVLIFSVMSWGGISARIKGLEHSISALEPLPFEERYIDFSRIWLTENGNTSQFSSFQELTGWNCLGRPGRITIRGGNGAGKSTLLIGLKTYFKERAYYYSPNMQIYFPESFGASLSVGEEVLANVEAVCSRTEADILLLDEWDANLDEANGKRIHQLLEEQAKTRCVVEVRHRWDLDDKTDEKK